MDHAAHAPIGGQQVGGSVASQSLPTLRSYKRIYRVMRKAELKQLLAMKERDVAADFARIWNPYPIHTIVNTAEPGWPDRFLQLQHSTVVGVEFKLLQATTRRIYKLGSATFRKEQAAWFAKWQRHGGYCMLFCGVNDHMSVFQGFDIITCTEWMDWIHINEYEWKIGERELLKSDAMVRTRVREWLQTKRLSQKRDEGASKSPLTQQVDSGSHSVQERVDA